MDALFSVILVAFIMPLILQGIFNLYLTLYGWESADRIANSRAPKDIAKPRTGFSVLLPCYHEEEVIGETLRKLSTTDYPKKHIELLVIVRSHDTGTIEAAQKSIDENNITNARVLIYSGDVPGKPPQLNAGLKAAKKKIVTVFDSEDDVSPQLFNAINTLFVTRKPDVIQGGVQLMDFHNKWFSLLNVLEYFFWFRSCMHFFARVGAMPLGGNTVFFHRKDLKELGGWDESLLTEDADIGFRLSLKGKKTIVMYDPELVTKEETPPSAEQFIKQRTRWVQGFLQILQKGDWKKLPTRPQRALALYVMFTPVLQAYLFMITPMFIAMGLFISINVYLGLISFAPLAILLCWFAAQMVGLYEFGKEQGVPVGLKWYARIIVTFPLYQAILSYASIRATLRFVKGSTNWEKTKHVGGHRTASHEDVPLKKSPDETSEKKSEKDSGENTPVLAAVSVDSEEAA